MYPAHACINTYVHAIIMEPPQYCFSCQPLLLACSLSYTLDIMASLPLIGLQHVPIGRCFLGNSSLVERSRHSRPQFINKCINTLLYCRPDLFALPITRVAGIDADGYHLLGWREPWAPSAIGNSSFMFAESGQFLLNRSRFLPIEMTSTSPSLGWQLI